LTKFSTFFPLPNLQRFSTISTGYDPLSPFHSSAIFFLKAKNSVPGIKFDHTPFIIKPSCGPRLRIYVEWLKKWTTKFVHFYKNTRNAGGDKMKCPRCHGLMVINTCLNVENVINTVWVYEWRCLNCGEIVDAQTLANRISRQERGSPGHAKEVA
jgi:hypothetical protein